MSKTVIIKVEKVINVDIRRVNEILLDLDNYPQWWKKYHLTYDKKNAILSFRPISFIDLKLKLLNQGDGFIRFQYVEGPLRGFVIWEFTEIENRKTHISNTTTVWAQNMFSNLVLSTPFFKWKHKSDINYLIKLIEDY